MARLRNTDRTILIAAALVLTLFSYFLYDDSLLFPRPNDASLERIGEVSVSSNDVRVKTSNAFTWTPAQKKDAIHRDDSIFTGENSEASIALNDGTHLQLRSNSLVTLKRRDGQMLLDLRYGAIEGKLGDHSNLKVTSGDKEFELGGQGSFDLGKPSAGPVNIDVSGTKVKGRAPKKESSVSLTTPARAKFLRVAADEAIPLEWKPKGTFASYALDLCATAACQSVLKTIPTKEPRANLGADVKDGESHWRVRGLDRFEQTVATSDARSFVVETVPTPTITTPGGDEAAVRGALKLTKPTDPVEGDLEITWSVDPRLAKYQYQIANEATFATPLLDAATATGSVRTPKLTNGDYTYRVRGQTADGRATAWSSPAQFHVALEGVVPRAPAAPVFARKVFTFDPAEQKAREPSSVPKPVLSWSRPANAASYQIEISKAPDFKNAKTYALTASAMSWGDYGPGRWHVRAFSIGTDGLKSGPSAPALLEVVLRDPVMKPIGPRVVRANDAAEKAPPLPLETEWTPVPFAKSYVLEVASTKEFSASTKLISTTPALKVTLPKPGGYYFRVQAMDQDNAPLTQPSAIVDAQYAFKEAMAPPRLMEPFDRASVFLQKIQEPFIWLEWKAVEDATRYEIEVSTDPAFQTALVRSHVNETRFLLKQRIPEGKLYWRVRTVIDNENKISLWSSPRVFTVITKKNEVHVE